MLSVPIEIEGNFTWTEENITEAEDSTTLDVIPCGLLDEGL